MNTLLHYSITTHPFFSLAICHKRLATYIDMELYIPITSTSYLPHTATMLKRILPTIYTATCFNNKNLPFAKELRRTEIGHLFEHIMLEYLYLIKTSHGRTDVIYNGETYWNWYKEAPGTFHIVIDSGITDASIFPLALERSIQLTNHILEKSSAIVRTSSVSPTILTAD